MHALYIHWPFCPYKCHFCPFVAFSKHDAFMEQYHKALTREIVSSYPDQTFQGPVHSIYFGGGTPSTYPEELLLDMFGTLRKVSIFDEDTEITLEVNPGTVTKEKLKLYKRLGVNRLSIGVQSLKESALMDLNRLQTTQDVHDVVQGAEGLFENVSIDLILGLPNVSAADWKEQLKQIVHWPIAHISCYFLMVHEFTPLWYRVKKADIALPVDDEVVDLYQWTIDYLLQHGFQHYEISSFARAGFRSEHNQAYWQRMPYRGFGVGAWSFDGSRRYRNRKNLMRYMHGVEQAEDIISFSEELTDQQVALEKVMLGLRQTEGVPINQLMHWLAHKDSERLKQQIIAYKNEGLLTEQNGAVQLTPAGLAVEQEVIAQLAG